MLRWDLKSYFIRHMQRSLRIGAVFSRAQLRLVELVLQRFVVVAEILDFVEVIVFL